MGLRRFIKNLRRSSAQQDREPEVAETTFDAEPVETLSEALQQLQEEPPAATVEDGPSDDELRYQYFVQIIDHVDRAVDLIRTIEDRYLDDQAYIENTLIPALGLNNEILNEQPAELSAYFGTGLHLWQYPSQFASYLVWLAQNAKEIKSYAEIGCRWGGTFIIINEWLRRIGAPIEFAIACDPVEITPFVRRYQEICDWPIHYRQQFSTDADFVSYIQEMAPEFVFIDGDHSLEGVMHDHMITRAAAKIIVHHDITSDICWGSTFFWRYVKASEDNFEAFEFTQQYESVQGSYLGIGVLKRKA